MDAAVAHLVARTDFLPAAMLLNAPRVVVALRVVSTGRCLQLNFREPERATAVDTWTSQPSQLGAEVGQVDVELAYSTEAVFLKLQAARENNNKKKGRPSFMAAVLRGDVSFRGTQDRKLLAQLGPIFEFLGQRDDGDDRGGGEQKQQQQQQRLEQKDGSAGISSSSSTATRKLTVQFGLPREVRGVVRYDIRLSATVIQPKQSAPAAVSPARGGTPRSARKLRTPRRGKDQRSSGKDLDQQHQQHQQDQQHQQHQQDQQHQQHQEQPNRTWRIAPRFSDFVRLHKDVSAALQGTPRSWQVPSAPTRGNALFNTKLGLAARRRVDLERYLLTVLRIPGVVAGVSAVRAFLSMPADVVVPTGPTGLVVTGTAAPGHGGGGLDGAAAAEAVAEAAASAAAAEEEVAVLEEEVASVKRALVDLRAATSAAVGPVSTDCRARQLASARGLAFAGHWALGGAGAFACLLAAYTSSRLASRASSWLASRLLPAFWQQRWQQQSSSLPLVWGLLSSIAAATVRGVGGTLGGTLAAAVVLRAWRRWAALPSTQPVKRAVIVFYATLLMLVQLKLTRFRAARLETREEKDVLWTEVNTSLGIFLHRAIRQLGGFWIKAGQYMSAREDVTPEEYVRELSQLQDAAPPKPFEAIAATLGGEARMRETFATFDPEPLATASIAQVHRATLRPEARVHPGDPTTVVVKVKHQGIDSVMLQDLRNLGRITRLVAWLEPEFNFEPIMREWVSETKKELDFSRESTNVRDVGAGLREFAPRLDVEVPQIVETARPMPAEALVLAFFDGQKVNNLDGLRTAGVDRRALLWKVTRAFASQIFDLGVFNGDPHPGNLLVSLKGKSAGRVALLDFGLCKRLEDPMRLALAEMVVAADDRDLGLLMEAFADMGIKKSKEASAAASRDGLDMDLVRFFFRDTAPKAEARKQLLRFDKQMQELHKSRKAMKVRPPVEAYPGDLLFFIRALELLRGLASSLEVRQSPLRILARTARRALRRQLMEAAAEGQGPAPGPAPGPAARPAAEPAVGGGEGKNAKDKAEGRPKTTSRLAQDLAAILADLQAQGQLLGAQVAVMHRGETVADVSAGRRGPSDPRPVTSDTLFNVFSVTKGIAVTAVHLLVQDGKIDYEAPVASYWPAFAAAGKDKITVAELLSHRAGLQHALPTDLSLDKLNDWPAMVAAIAAAAPARKPADPTAANYHYLTFGWLVGGLVEAVTGDSFISFFRRRITEPLGLADSLMIGIPREWLVPPWDPAWNVNEGGRLATLENGMMPAGIGRGGGGVSAGDDVVVVDDDDDDDDGELDEAMLDDDDEVAPEGVDTEEIQKIIDRFRDKQKEQHARAVQPTAAAAAGGDDAGAPGGGAEDAAEPPDDGAEDLANLLESFKGKEFLLDMRIYNSRSMRSAIIPAANAHASAHALAMLYASICGPTTSTAEPLLGPALLEKTIAMASFETQGANPGGDIFGSDADKSEGGGGSGSDGEGSQGGGPEPARRIEWGMGYQRYPFRRVGAATQTTAAVGAAAGGGGETKVAPAAQAPAGEHKQASSRVIGFGHAGIGGSIAMALPSEGVAFAMTVNRLTRNRDALVRIVGRIAMEFGLESELV